MGDVRREFGVWGERVAADALTRWGVEIVERNRTQGRGEVDLVGRIGHDRVLIEVRTVRGGIDFERSFPMAKRRQLRSLAGQLGIHRIDLVAVAVGPAGVEVHWLRDVPTD